MSDFEIAKMEKLVGEYNIWELKNRWGAEHEKENQSP